MMASSISSAELFDKFERHFRATINTAYSPNGELDKVVHYILSGPGKRVRALLTLLSGQLFEASFDRCFPSAMAVEFVHAYSLVHDDLPCMDNDTYRRGRLTAHVQFNETMALLGGDAILADAFHVLASDQFRGVKLLQPDHVVRAKLVSELARSIGTGGMVLGQVLDLHWTARDGYTEADLTNIHQLKTGRLIASSCTLGAILAGATPEATEKLRAFGEAIGLVYQIVDDLLDDADGLGKSSGKDKATGKLTYLRVMTRPQAEALAEKLTVDAMRLLDDLGKTNEIATNALRDYAHQLLNRRH